MAEEMAAEIWIGGKIFASRVPALCEAIRRQAVSLEWGDSAFQPGTAKDLENACRRRSDGKYDVDPELVDYRPGRAIVTVRTDRSGQPVVPLDGLMEVEARLAEALRSAWRHRAEALLGAVRSARRLLQKRLPPAVPPLRPFRIFVG